MLDFEKDEIGNTMPNKGINTLFCHVFHVIEIHAWIR